MSYVKIPMRFFQSDTWLKKRVWSKAELVLWLHSKQSFTDSEVVIDGYKFEVKVGEVVVSTRYLEQLTGWSRARVFRFLNETSNETTYSTRFDTTHVKQSCVLKLKDSAYLGESGSRVDTSVITKRKTSVRSETRPNTEISLITGNTLITESNIIDLNVADESHVDHQSSPLKNLIEDNTLSTKSKNSSKGKTKNSKQSTTLSLDLNNNNNNNINNNSSTPLKGSTTNKDLINALDCLDDKENCDLYLTNQQIEDLIQQLGNEYFHLCYKITEWIREKNHLGGKWWRTNHYETILKWHKNNTSTGKRFYHHPEYGMNYYPTWQIEKFQKEAA